MSLVGLELEEVRQADWPTIQNEDNCLHLHCLLYRYSAQRNSAEPYEEESD